MPKKNENLYDYAQRKAKSLKTVPSYIKTMKNEIENGVCHNCKEVIKDYTSKKGYTYKANKDLSVHAIFLNDNNELVCSKNRAEFNDFKERFQQSRENAQLKPKEITPKNIHGNWLKENITTLKEFIDTIQKEFPKWTTIDIRITAGMLFNNFKEDERAWAKP